MNKYTNKLGTSICNSFGHWRAKAVLLLVCAGALLSSTARAQATYYWKGAPGASWSPLTNWSTGPNGTGTTRTARSNDDILVFSSGTPTVLIDDATAPIGQLQFIGSTSATLTTPQNTARIITINGNATGADFVVGSGSDVTVVADVSGSGNAELDFALGATATASIAGPVTLTSSGGGANADANHQFRGATAGAIHFTSGGSLIVTGKMDSNPFENTPGLAVFEMGSTLEQNSAGSEDPYGNALFEEGSTYRYVAGNFGTPSTSRTYGNFVYASNGNESLAGSNALTFLNDLSIAGTGTFSITATAPGATTTGTSIAGNIVLTNSNGELLFNPGAIKSLSFNGTSPQTISGSGTLTFGSNATLEIKNPAGATLSRPITARGLLLTQGILTTSTAGLLTLSANATITGGSSTSFVNGPLARTTDTGARTTFFPIGKGTVYRAVTLITQTQTNTVTYTAEQLETPPVQVFFAGSGLTRVSHRRSFQLSPSVVPAGYLGAVTLTFGLDDFVNYPAALSFVIGKNSGPATPWINAGYGSNTGASNGGLPVTGTLTSGQFNVFPVGANFVLASTGPLSNTAVNSINPLPVELTFFSAQRQVDNAVALKWATASEKNNDRFEVQRSASGTAFETIASVKGQGNSTSTHDYALLDTRPLPTLAYYRLRQVDADGTATFSPVMAVGEKQMSTETDVAVYPNPSAGSVTLPAALGPVRYRVFNLLGQTMLSGQATGNDHLDLSSLAKGAYFLEFSNEAGRTTQRLVRD